jgi:alpha-tubulin suppressor-like RCC1 family protein
MASRIYWMRGVLGCFLLSGCSLAFGADRFEYAEEDASMDASAPDGGTSDAGSNDGGDASDAATDAGPGCAWACTGCTPGTCNDPIAVAGGARHTCALRQNGEVVCWGDNTYGQLGTSAVTESLVPIPVAGVAAVELSAGAFFTCARLSTGLVACWGRNEYGQLGRGTSEPMSSTPEAVSGLVNAEALDVGTGHVCALVLGGSVRCWGRNLFGALGNGGTTDSNLPVTAQGLDGLTVVDVVASALHTCALDAAGLVHCWGADGVGQLGDGSATAAPGPVEVSALTGALEIESGSDYTCARPATGSLMCWGANMSGNLGSGRSGAQLAPFNVLGLDAAEVVQLAAKNFTTYARMSTGEVFSWGLNDHGQVGDATTISRESPVFVREVEDAILVAAGGLHACAIRRSGAVVCWGDNTYGQLGDGTMTDASTPVLVTSPD